MDLDNHEKKDRFEKVSAALPSTERAKLWFLAFEKNPDSLNEEEKKAMIDEAWEKGSHLVDEIDSVLAQNEARSSDAINALVGLLFTILKPDHRVPFLRVLTQLSEKEARLVAEAEEINVSPVCKSVELKEEHPEAH